MKQVQIPQELFVQLIHYHLMEDDSYMDEIRIGLEQKLDAMVLRELYGKAKTAPTETERKKARQEYKRTLSLLRKAQKQALHSTREELEKAMEQVRQARAEKGEALRRLRLVQRLFLRWDEEEEEDETGNH